MTDDVEFIPLEKQGDVIREQRAEIEQLKKLVKTGEAVVDDFMQNISNCALQDYGRLNQFLIDASKVAEQNNESDNAGA